MTHLKVDVAHTYPGDPVLVLTLDSGPTVAVPVSAGNLRWLWHDIGELLEKLDAEAKTEADEVAGIVEAEVAEIDAEADADTTAEQAGDPE